MNAREAGTMMESESEGDRLVWIGVGGKKLAVKNGWLRKRAEKR